MHSAQKYQLEQLMKFFLFPSTFKNLMEQPLNWPVRLKKLCECGRLSHKQLNTLVISSSYIGFNLFSYFYISYEIYFLLFFETRKITNAMKRSIASCRKYSQISNDCLGINIVPIIVYDKKNYHCNEKFYNVWVLSKQMNGLHYNILETDCTLEIGCT